VIRVFRVPARSVVAPGAEEPGQAGNSPVPIERLGPPAFPRLVADREAEKPTPCSIGRSTACNPTAARAKAARGAGVGVLGSDDDSPGAGPWLRWPSLQACLPVLLGPLRDSRAGHLAVSFEGRPWTSPRRAYRTTGSRIERPPCPPEFPVVCASTAGRQFLFTGRGTLKRRIGGTHFLGRLIPGCCGGYGALCGKLEAEVCGGRMGVGHPPRVVPA